MDLSIIIVSFNTKNLLLDCISSIEKTVKKNKFEIIVIDNVSTDGTREVLQDLEKKNKNIHIILNEKNEGFSKANNRGVKKACGKYILFLNPDMIIFEKTIDGMIEFIKKEKNVGAATCFLELPDGKLDDAAHRGFPTPWNSFTHFTGLAKLFPESKLFSGYSQGFKNFEKTHEVDVIAGAFMLVPKKVGGEVEWWDEDYFWYGEDIDFCYRLKKKGWKIMFVPEFRALHYKGASGGIKKSSNTVSSATNSTKKKAQKARFDAMRIFYKKHYKNKYPRVISNLVLKGISLRHFLTRITS